MKKCFLILFVILLLACGKNDASSQNVTETAATPTVATIETQTATPVTESVPAVTENAPPPTENVPAVAETAPPAMENVPTVAETAPTENVVAATENVSPATESVPAVTKVQPAEETAAGTVPVIAPNQDKPVEADKVEAAAGTVPAPKGEDVPARVISVTGQHGDKAVSVEILFTKPVKDGFDPTPYILVRDVAGGTALEVKPAVVKDTIQVRGNFEPDREYEVTVLKGIPAIDDSKTEDDLSGRVRFLEREPKLAFLNEGILLPSTADRSVVLRSLNVTKVRVKVWKVFENNFTQFLHDFYFKENGANSYGNNLLGDWQLPRVAEEVADKEFTINNVKNKWVQSSLSLKGILDGKGIYIVNVSFPRDGISYEFDPNLSEWQRDNLFYRGTIHKAILLTDVALIAQKDGSGKYYVSAVDIPKNAPLPGAKVQLISKTNQILGEKFTDGDGNAVFEDNTKNAFYVVAEHNDKKSLLKLDAPLSMDGFKVGGAFATEGIRAFVFTERGVYRPGDAIHVGIIARNENTVLPDDHPVKITVYTPTGSKYIEDALIKEGKDGFYVWEFATKTEDNTGVWKLSAAIGSHVVTKEILVETVVPYKIQNTVTAPESIAAGDGKFSWTVDSKYLFGAPAAGLAVEGDVIIREEPVEFEQYKNYNFVTPGSYYNVSHESFSGVLDEKGHFSAVTDISNVTYRSLNVLLDLHPRVIEEGGRPVLSRATVKIKKFDNYLGVEKNARYLGNKKPVNIKVVTPSADGEKLTAGRNLEYKVYYNRYSWWWDYNYYEDF
ncbi:MAG: hypothetical protein LBQ96_03755, partial [Fusobacteriaceae bacterium]|nr:hypothetical protein [Fusobacteriaceae bacterium]